MIMCQSTFMTACCVWSGIAAKYLKVPMLIHEHHQKHLQQACDQNWTREHFKVVWSDELCFHLHYVDSQVHVHPLPEEETPGYNINKSTVDRSLHTNCITFLLM